MATVPSPYNLRMPLKLDLTVAAIAEDSGRFLFVQERAARRVGIRMSARKTGFLITGTDRVGACASVVDRLAKAKINVTAMDGVTAGGGRWGALLWVKPRDVARAARVLGAK